MARKSIYSEHQIQTQIIHFLRNNGYYVQRMNSGMIPMGEGRSRRLIRMNRAGTPDVMAFKGIWLACATCGENVQHNHLLFIEVKVPGNEPTLLQQAVMQELEEHGARCLVIHSVEELEAVL